MRSLEARTWKYLGTPFFFVYLSANPTGQPAARFIALSWTQRIKAKLAGATVFHGPLSYGHGDRINDEFNVDAPGNLPAIVEIIDLEEKIEAFLPQLDTMIGSGLVTLEKVQMARIGRRTKGAAIILRGG